MNQHKAPKRTIKEPTYAAIAPYTPPAPPAEPVAEHVANERMLRLDAVIEATGLSKSLIYKLMEMGEFPKKINIAPR